MEITRILDAALRKAAAVWITSPGHEPRLVHAHWRDDALWVITGGTEQEVPGLSRRSRRSPSPSAPPARTRTSSTPRPSRELTEPDDETTQALKTARLNTKPEWDAVYRLEFGA